ncbi:NUDIX hydrolase [Kitasatospora sp. NBC_01246]|uniref:NUDIX hydrolase n=1 Tax=Kitasatospora sp. NBC_01246 TaxID=2903570 RepID=UPI002E2FBAB9|nr:NUDIX hydrolase [Kitasatospora sp. NBC_01246]
MNPTPMPDPELARYLVAHPAPAACADALIRDHLGRVLIVDPDYKPGWDLPGGMLEDEEPEPALVRELQEELGLDAEIGRLLAVDTAPAELWGRAIISLVYAARPRAAVEAAALVLQPGEIRAAKFVPEREALTLLAPTVARRFAAAAAAERGAHTALLRDGHRPPMPPRDHFAQLPAPMAAATVLVRDTAGRVLVLDPSYKPEAELPGGMVEACESPEQAAARELREELALDLPVGRLLVVDTAPATATGHGRAVTCFLYDAAPLTAAQAGALRFADGEVRAASWLDPGEAVRQLPRHLAARLTAALRALEDGGIIHLRAGVPATPAQGAGATAGGRAPAPAARQDPQGGGVRRWPAV